MSFWNIFGNMAVSDKGETMTRLSKDMCVSSQGVTYTQMGNMTYGSDGSSYNQIESFSSDGSTRFSSITTGRGALFNGRLDESGDLSNCSRSDQRFGFDDNSKW